MASCKAGKPGTIVAPIAVIEVHEADDCDPVKVSENKAQQREKRKGKYGAVSAKANSTEKTEEKEDGEKKTWVEIELVDSQGKVLAGEPYEIKMGEEVLSTGTTDEKGMARIEGIDPGSVDIIFPRIDQTRWDRKS